jgi:diaminopimelate epimerase
MTQILFSKMVAAGNDFVVVDARDVAKEKNSLSRLSRDLCNRKNGIGADGVLVLEKLKVRDTLRMRIFNADGSEAEMCGNGARCAAWFAFNRWEMKQHLHIETLAGTVNGQILMEKKSSGKGCVKIKLTTPKNIKLRIPLKAPTRTCKVNFINTGVPHTVIFVEDLAHIDVKELGKYFRFHRYFAPRGTNVNFVQVTSIQVRTYERGVEDETLACGTGVSASAIITALEHKKTSVKNTMNVLTQSGEILKVHFTRIRDIIGDVWLEGDARFVFDGSISS